MSSRDKVFISYRRTDSQPTVTALRQTLERHVGPDRVYQDVTGIDPGEVFPDVLRAELVRARVVIAVIGPQWLTVADKWGQRRLDKPTDWVRIELAESLANPQVTVIPLLVEGATMPSVAEGTEALPEPLVPLVSRQAVNADHDNWDRSLQPLIDEILALLGAPPAGEAPTTPASVAVTQTATGDGNIVLGNVSGDVNIRR